MRPVGSVAPGAEPGEPPEGEEGELGRVKPDAEREGLWLLGLGRIEGGALGRTDGVELGRTPGLDPRDGLGTADGREELPPDGREATEEPRDPWLEAGRLAEGREAEPPLDPREGEAEEPPEPLEPRCGSE